MPAAMHLNRRNVVAVVLLLATVATCVSLGRWQLRRAAQRDAIAAAISAARQMPPADLNVPASSRNWQEWQPAQARGVWLNDYSVLLDNRNLQGRPGLWLVTPLRLDGAADAALLVLRGWLARPVNFPARALTLPAPSTGSQSIQGHVRLHVPRLYELWQRDGFDASALPAVWSAATPPVVQNLELERYAQATGLTLLPVVLEQTALAQTDAPDDGLIRQWATPSLDSDKNKGYALQWFSFAAIAGIALLALLWRSWKTPSAID